MSISILPASEVRSQWATILKDLGKEQRTCFVTKNGRAVAALLSMESYERLMSDLEDRLDETDETLSSEVAQARQQLKAGRTQVWRSRHR
jgi:prevent-host-death family protein